MRFHILSETIFRNFQNALFKVTHIQVSNNINREHSVQIININIHYVYPRLNEY